MDVFRLMGRIAIDNSDAISAMNETSTQGDTTQGRLSSAFQKIGAAINTYFSVDKLLEFSTALINLAADAETAMAKVTTLLTSGTDTTAFFQSIIDASNRTGVSVGEYSEAVYQAISAGVSQADAVAFVERSIMLAKGGFTDTTTAVDILTTAINAYGLTVEDAAHVSDVMIMTQNLGKTSVNELASSMGKILPLAAAYGVNIENIGAAYAIMTAGGIGTAEATTYMKSMMTELGKDGSKVSDILKQRTGKSFSELMEAGLSLGDILAILYDSVDGDATAFANLWSSTEAGTGALAIVNAGAEEFNGTLGQMQDSAGSTEQAYSIMTDTFREKWNRMKNTFKNAGIMIGSKFLPALEKIVDGITEWVIPAFEKFASYFDGVFGEDGTIDWDAFGEACGNMFRDLGKKLPGLLRDLGNAIVSAWENAVWPMIQGLFSAAFGIDLPDWSVIKNTITSWWNTIRTKAEEIIRVVFGIEGGDTWENVKQKFVDWWNNTKNFVTALFQAIFGIEGGASWEDVSSTFQTWWDGISGFVTNIFTAIWKLGEGNETWEAVMNIFITWWDGIKNNVSAIFSAVWKLADGTLEWEDVKNIFVTWWDGIKNFIPSVLQAAWKLAEGNETWEAVVNIFQTWWDGISSYISSIFNAVWKLADGTLTWEDVKSIFVSWWEGIKNFIPSVLQAGWKLAEGNETWEDVMELFQTWWDGISSYISSIFNAVWKLADGTLTWEDVGDIFVSWWEAIKGYVESVFTFAWKITVPLISEVVQAIKEWWEDVKAQIGSLFTFTFNLLPPSVQEGINTVTTWWSDAKDWFFFDDGYSIFGGGNNGDSHGGGTGRHFANGTDFVERDQQPAILHYGEAVLNRTDAKTWRDGSGTGGMMALADKMDAMINLMQNGIGGNQQIVLDTGVLVGSTVGMYDNQLGMIAGRKGRGN